MTVGGHEVRVRDDDLIVAVDVGSCKVVVAIATLDDMGELSVIGLGCSESSTGVKEGCIININSITEAITEAVNQAEMQAGREVKSVFIAVSGKDVKSQNELGFSTASGVNKEIRRNDIERAVELAKGIAISSDRRIMHVLPRWYKVDRQDNIQDPLGMFGTRLEANVHIITTAESAIGNVLRCFERMNIGVNSIFLQNIADARAVLSDDEKELGVLLLDIGAETTNVSVYYKQAPLYTTVFQKMGGDQITFDLSKGFGIPLGTAEKLKCEMGVADYSCVDESAKIQIPAVGGRPAKIHNRSEVVDYIQPRLLEIFGTIRERLKENDLLECINGGVVIIGGTALLPGIEAVAQQVFGVAVRVGALRVLGGLGDKINSPEYSVVNGVLELGAELANYEGGAEVKARRSDGKDTFMNKVSDFFKQFF